MSLVPSLTRYSIEAICHFCLDLLWLFSSLLLDDLAIFIDNHLNCIDVCACASCYLLLANEVI